MLHINSINYMSRGEREKMRNLPEKFVKGGVNANQKGAEIAPRP